jgi:ketosteroid isomerase-like protein
MRKFSIFLLLCAGICSTFGQTPKPAGDVETLKQLERDWTAAQKAGDVEKLSQIIADDWTGLGYDGAKSTKQQVLNDVKGGQSKIASIELGPMDVKLIGAVAIVQGSDTEKSSFKGKDTSGKWVWTDVFEKRNGKWQAVRSQGAIVK